MRFQTLFQRCLAHRRHRPPATATALVTLSLALSPGAFGKQEPIEQPEDQWYQINFLVFQHLKGKTQGEEAERWPRQVELAYPKLTTFLQDKSEEPINPLTYVQKNYSLINDPETGFAKENLNIRRSAGFRTLFYKQWHQKLGTGVTGQATAISGGKSFGAHDQLEGWVRFSQRRYLHLEVDLWLHDYERSHQYLGIQTSQVPLPIPEPEQLLKKLFNFKLSEFAEPLEATELDNPDQPPVAEEIPFYIRKPKRVISYQMHQHRRMRSNELHHLDHPLLGVLVEAIPYEPEKTQKVDDKTAVWLRPMVIPKAETLAQ